MKAYLWMWIVGGIPMVAAVLLLLGLCRSTFGDGWQGAAMWLITSAPVIVALAVAAMWAGLRWGPKEFRR